MRAGGGPCGELRVDAKVARAIKVGGREGVLFSGLESRGRAAVEAAARVSPCLARPCCPAPCRPLSAPSRTCLPQPAGATLSKVWGSTLYHRDDLPFPASMAGMPDVFTPFKDAAERKSQVRGVGSGARVAVGVMGMLWGWGGEWVP
jgi:hypothetical protein